MSVSVRTLPFALAFLLSAESVSAQQLGSNTRAYVSANQQFAAPCATSGFLGGPAWTAGNVTMDCNRPGYLGHSYSSFNPYSFSTSSSVSTAGIDLNGLPGTNKGLVSLSRAVVMDQMLVSSSSATPDSVRFTFGLTVSTANSLGVNTRARNTANFGVGFNTMIIPPLSQNVVMTSGYYSYTYAYFAGLLDTWVSFAPSILNFANLTSLSTDQNIAGVNGTNMTAAWAGLDFLQATGNGAGVDITSQVDVTFASGNDYTATVTPEPSAVVLLATGLAGIIVVRRRRRAS